MSYRYAVLLAVLALRLWELYFSWRRLREEMRGQRAALLHDPIYPAMVGLHAAWFAGCLAEVMLLRPLFHGWLVLPMLAAWMAALGLRVWTIASMGAQWNVRLIERARQPVVASGPFCYIRHPNYLAVIIEIAAVPLLVGAYWTALAATVVNGLVLWRRIATEEAYLFQFPAYEQAFREKKRLLPGVF